MDVHPRKNVLQFWTHPIYWILEIPCKLLMESSNVPLQWKHYSFLFLIHAIDPHVIGELCIRRVALHRALGCIDQHFNHLASSQCYCRPLSVQNPKCSFVNVVKKTLESGQSTNDVHSRHQQLLHGIWWATVCQTNSGTFPRLSSQDPPQRNREGSARSARAPSFCKELSLGFHTRPLFLELARARAHVPLVLRGSGDWVGSDKSRRRDPVQAILVSGFSGCFSDSSTVTDSIPSSWPGKKAYMSSRSHPLGWWRPVASIRALLKITWLGGLNGRLFFSLPVTGFIWAFKTLFHSTILVGQ